MNKDFLMLLFLASLSWAVLAGVIAGIVWLALQAASPPLIGG